MSNCSGFNKSAMVSFLVLSMCAAAVIGGCHAGTESAVRSSTPQPQGTQDLARLLVKLELRTRAVVAGHYVQADQDHRDWMANRLLLPAGVADQVFHEVVPEATADRAWVKMAVPNPRNANNQPDEVGAALMRSVMDGQLARADRRTADAYYYAEPIVAAGTCLVCHGSPAGEPDPYFPQYVKNGWQAGETIGAVVARVKLR